MTPKTDFLTVLSHASPHSPLDLDTALFDAPDPGALAEIDTGGPLPGARLWPMADPAVSYIGCRVTAAISRPEHLAARLAAIAIERQVHPVFLSYIAECGMQRFGFRVEQLSGLTSQDQSHFEAQLSQFWQFALVLDVAQLKQFG